MYKHSKKLLNFGFLVLGLLIIKPSFAVRFGGITQGGADSKLVLGLADLKDFLSLHEDAEEESIGSPDPADEEVGPATDPLKPSLEETRATVSPDDFQ